MKKLFISVIFVAVLAIVANAQSKTITINGKVTSFEESLPLEGVSVQVKGADNNTGTQADGTFNIVVSANDKVLLIRLAGYQPKEVPITATREYDIVLKSASSIRLQNKMIDTGVNVAEIEQQAKTFYPLLL